MVPAPMTILRRAAATLALCFGVFVLAALYSSVAVNSFCLTQQWQIQQGPCGGAASALDDGSNGEPSGPILLAERSVNRVTLVGRVGLDPEIRHLPSGDRMANFSLATSEHWREKATGEVRTRTEWHRIVVFDRALVDLVENFVHKGRRLYVEGSLQTRRWVTAEGQERYTTEVLLAKFKGELVLLEGSDEWQGGGSSERAASRASASDMTNGPGRSGEPMQGFRSSELPNGPYGQPKLGTGSRALLSSHNESATGSRASHWE